MRPRPLQLSAGVGPTKNAARMRTPTAIASVFFLGLATGGRTKALERLPRCAAPRLVGTSDWVRLDQGAGFSLSLPPCFRPDDDEAPHYVHGGRRWRCRAGIVEIVWGMWGPGSFGHECRTSVAGVPVTVAHPSKQAPGLRAWYLTGAIHEPIIVASSTEAADMPLLTTIAYSGQLSIPRGSNR